MENTLTTKTKIIDAALIEFGSKGYKDASTNQIYPMAKVSKGAIFKIFGSKAKLFFAVYDRAIKQMIEELNRFSFDTYDDIFERIFGVMMWKVEYAQKHPYDTAVMMEGITDPPKEIKELIYSNLKSLTKLSMHYFFEDMPMENIREEYSKAQVLEILEMSVAGLQATYVDKNMDMTRLESIREKSILYLKTVVRGMEKDNG